MYTPLQQQHEEFWLLLCAAPSSYLIPLWAAVLLSPSSIKRGRRCKETVGECFTYIGTQRLKDCPMYPSGVNYEVTGTRRQTFLTFFLSSMTMGQIVPIIHFLPSSNSFSYVHQYFHSFIQANPYIFIGKYAAGRETKPDTRTETLQDREKKQLLVTKTISNHISVDKGPVPIS